ncbi:MAG: UvrD-helicase domain-containing protein [Clostridia bacterium]
MQQQHGSGKTAVLVERIINKITNENIDIDKLLIVTFTNAAATEMRERILKAIYEKLEKEPDNSNLQRQILLLNKANISTIHAFCLDVIKNNFYQTDISPNFRLASTPEIELLKMEVLEEVFDKLYEEKNNEFINLVNIYGGYRDDEDLKELILKIYKFIRK